VTLSGRVRCSAATTIRYAVLNWRGVADTVTSDIVNDWTSAVYDEAGFFIANARPLTNLLGAVATGSVAVAAGAWTALAPLSGTVSSTGSNLIVVIWTESTQAQNVTLDIGEAQLERGIVRTPFEKRPLALELAMCQRFYEKSFPLDIAPAQNAGVDGMMTFSQGVAASTGQGGMFFPFKVAKRIAPTVVTYNPLAASAQIRNNTTSSNWTATTATGRHGGLQVSGTSPAGTALGDTASMHWSADAEL
jgi:hypothetical protein